MADTRHRIHRSESSSVRGTAFWIVVVFGIATVVVAGLAATVIGLRFWDRHSNMSGILESVWFHAGNIVDSPAFVVAYVVIPLGWAALAVWWWTRSPLRRRVPAVLRILYSVTALVGAGAWLVSLLWRIRAVFESADVPQLLIKVGVSDADRREPLIVLGLACLLAAALVYIAMMFYETRPERRD